MLIASMLWETAQSRTSSEEVERRRKLKICSQESNWRRPARPAAWAVLLLLSVCKATAVSAQHGRRGKEGEQEGEGDCALHVCSYPNHAPGLHSNNAHRSGLVVILAHPGRREWRGSGEGVKRERWQAGQH